MPRPAWILIGALVAVGAAWWIVRDHGERQAPVPARTALAPTTEATNSLTPLEPIAPEPQRVEVPVEPTTAVPTRSMRTEADQVILEGTVIVADENGIEHAGESGTLKIAVEQVNGIYLLVKAEAHNGHWVGQWSAKIGDFTRLCADPSVLGGRLAHPYGSRQFQPISMDTLPVLRLRWPAPMVLHARDAVTGAELTGVDVIEGGNPLDPRVVPAQTEGKYLFTQHGDSPLRISSEAFPPHRRLIFVRARGYAWCRVPCNPLVGGEIFADLTATCSLDVDVSGNDAPDRVILRLVRHGEANPIYDTPLGERTRIEIEDVPPGAYTIAAQLGDWTSTSLSLATANSSLTLAKADVELLPGVRGHVELTLTPAPHIERADMSGVLVIPLDWKPARISLVGMLTDTPLDGKEARPVGDLGAPTSTPESNTYEWRMTQLQVGHYDLSLIEPPFTIAVDLPPGGLSNVRMEIPPPTEVSVRVIDGDTNENVLVDQVTWNLKRPPESRGVRRSMAKHNAVTGTYDFRCPIGQVEVSTSSLETGYPRGAIVSDMHAGHNEVTLSLVKSTGISLSLIEGDKAFVANTQVDFDVSPVQGDGDTTSSQSRGGVTTIVLVSKPGRYSVRLKEPLPGYVMPEPQIVNLQPRTMTDVVIRLVRKQ